MVCAWARENGEVLQRYKDEIRLKNIKLPLERSQKLQSGNNQTDLGDLFSTQVYDIQINAIVGFFLRVETVKADVTVIHGQGFGKRISS